VVTIDLAAPGLAKRLELHADGAVVVTFTWTPHAPDEWFTTELSVSRPVTLETDGAREWRYPIETVAKSERGLERTVQGEAIVVGWPAERGRGRVRLAATW
jgi:hypothetical protein